MSTFGQFAVAAALLAVSACNHQNDRPMTPANGTTLSSDPTAPSVDPSVTDTPAPATPNSTPGVPNNDSRGTTMPGTEGAHDGSPVAPGASDGPHDDSGASPVGPKGAPVGGIH